MHKPIIIAVSGKKQSGKSSLCEYFKYSYAIKGTLCRVIQKNNGDIEIPFEPDQYSESYHDRLRQIKVYNFADKLKEILVDVFGLSNDQVYGTDEQKNTFTNIKWDTMSNEIRIKYSNKNDSSFLPILRNGYMTAREVMQVYGTDICRKMFFDTIWVDACLRKIEKENPKIALIADMRFRSELSPIISAGGYIIRLAKKVSEDNHESEIDLDCVDWTAFGSKACVIINDDMTINQKNKAAIYYFNEIINGKV